MTKSANVADLHRKSLLAKELGLVRTEQTQTNLGVKSAVRKGLWVRVPPMTLIF